MTYLVHPKRKRRWKTLRVPGRKQLLSGKHVCSPSRISSQLIRCEWQTLCLNAYSQRLSPLTQENFACILRFPLFLFILHTTVILIALFASVFNGYICLSKRDDGCMALLALTDIQGLFQSTGLFGEVQSGRLKH